MQQFKDKLSALVSDSKQKTINLPAIESKFIALVAETMSTSPLTDESINQIQKKLFCIFHPDKAPRFSDDVKWIEATLSQGENDGTCCKIITLCADRLKDPRVNTANHFEKAENIDDLTNFFTKYKKQSKTQVQVEFYTSLIGLLDAMKHYDNKLECIKYKNLKLGMQFLPLFCPHYLILIFHAEIAALYAVSALSSLIGHSIQKFGDKSLNPAANALMTAGNTGACGVSITLLRLYEMSYWICGDSYLLALQSGSFLCNTLNPPATNYFFYDFKSNGIHHIVKPFENYLKMNEQQFFREARLGAAKRQEVLKLLEKAKIIDNLPLSEEEQKEKLKSAIDCLANIPKMNTKTLAKTIKESYDLIQQGSIRAICS